MPVLPDDFDATMAHRTPSQRSTMTVASYLGRTSGQAEQPSGPVQACGFQHVAGRPLHVVDGQLRLCPLATARLPPLSQARPPRLPKSEARDYQIVDIDAITPRRSHDLGFGVPGFGVTASRSPVFSVPSPRSHAFRVPSPQLGSGMSTPTRASPRSQPNHQSTHHTACTNGTPRPQNSTALLSDVEPSEPPPATNQTPSITSHRGETALPRTALQSISAAIATQTATPRGSERPLTAMFERLMGTTNVAERTEGWDLEHENSETPLGMSDIDLIQQRNRGGSVNDRSGNGAQGPRYGLGDVVWAVPKGSKTNAKAIIEHESGVDESAVEPDVVFADSPNAKAAGTTSRRRETHRAIQRSVASTDNEEQLRKIEEENKKKGRWGIEREELDEEEVRKAEKKEKKKGGIKVRAATYANVPPEMRRKRSIAKAVVKQSAKNSKALAKDSVKQTQEKAVEMHGHAKRKTEDALDRHTAGVISGFGDTGFKSNITDDHQMTEMMIRTQKHGWTLMAVSVLICIPCLIFCTVQVVKIFGSVAGSGAGAETKIVSAAMQCIGGMVVFVFFVAIGRMGLAFSQLDKDWVGRSNQRARLSVWLLNRRAASTPFS